MSKSVFVSHAVKDRELAAEIVSLIEEGIGVPEAEIFCSSLKGYGIPTGNNFVTFIKEQMLEPKVVILLLTPSYFESKFCVSELGAAWIKSHYVFPILVPPLGYEDVKDVLLGTQVSKITDDIGYNELRDRLVEEIALDKKSSTKWDTKRRAFLKNIEPLLKEVAGPTTVPADQYKELVAKLEEAHNELDANEQELSELKKQLAETEKLKDRQEVAELQAKYGGNETGSALVQLNALAEKVQKELGPLRHYVLKMMALSDHYNVPFSANLLEDRQEIEEAVRRGIVKTEPYTQVVWGSPKMERLADALAAIDSFARSEAELLRKAAIGAEQELPIEPSTQDFWEFYFL
ncbi:MULTISPECIES: toll/interleukin-1 receptor domain-containing protein [Rhizobium]|uniref:toll/interleukin-1 receptor domain-containing protein n=1 Tax=Rhizobium TaxID=379 RepID=UPI00102FA748|nr:MULTISPECIES: toll/interleukin-1 receptor domain-containing protein [Rhizobium]TBE08791.1 TIR domain-containing protein [Rhizobium ruizarguesonis]WSH27046.1 toll/interleukin-1 receptor domain-containing protein [Rhizobium beringeri]WSH79917.1 toll/interleukin-1 receptor domain-containing protein [Rhizobium beringeri]